MRASERTAAALGALLATSLLATPCTAADEVADFYRGKTLTIVSAHEVGTGFDIYARVLQRHLGAHIPGNPSIVVQNMIGASGMIAANWLYAIAPKDGTVVGTFSSTVPSDPIVSSAGARFDPTKFNWIGNVDDGIGVCAIAKASGIEKFADMLTKETVLGATGTTGPYGKFAIAARNLLGAKIKVVSGYKGSADIKIATKRGEVHGLCGLPFSTLTSFWREDYESGAVKPIIQLSGRRVPELASIPHIDDFAKSPEDLQVFGLIFGVQAYSRLYAAPPGVPLVRRDALRAALTATTKDPQFLADAARTNIDINPISGEDVEAFIARISASSPAVVERAKAALRHD